MARLWSSGAELQSVVAGVEVTAFSASGVTIDTTHQRSGQACFAVAKASGASRGLLYQFASAVGTGPYYFRVYFKISSSFPASRQTMFALTNSATFDNSSSALIEVDYDPSTGKLVGHDTLVSGGAAADIGSSAVLSLDTWYRLEIKLDFTPAAGSKVVEFKLDGTVFGTKSTGSWTAGVLALEAGFDFDGASAGTGPIVYLDDLAINDSTGGAQTSYPGSGKIVHLQPDSAGDNAAWAAGVGGTANWNRVSEVSPDDATTYNQVSATGNQIDDHNCGSTAGAGIGSSDTVTLVQVGTRCGANGTSTPRDIKLRVKSQASGTVLAGSVLSCSLNGWATNGIAAPKNYSLTSYTDPQAGGSWTPSLLDAMQIGYQKNTSNTNATRVSSVWALVEYVPASASPQTVSPSGLSSAQSFGTIKANLTIFIGGLGSAQSMGAPSVTVGTVGQTVSVAGLGSAQRFGAVTPQPGPVIVLVLGIPSAQAFGSILANQTIRVGGVPSAQAFGTPTAIPGPATVSLTGLPSAQAFGTPQVTEPGGPTFSPAIHGGKHF